MAEYIERKRAIVDACNSLELYPAEYAKLEDALNKIPAADVAPVKHGWWVHNSDFPDRFICYGCGAMFDMWKHEQRLFNYCPNCGAQMNGESDEE